MCNIGIYSSQVNFVYIAQTHLWHPVSFEPWFRWKNSLTGRKKEETSEQKKAICHLDHYPPSPTATVDHPESSCSLYSAVQKSEQLICNLAEMTHQGARPLYRESEAFTPRWRLSLVWTPATTAALQPGFSSVICIRSLMHKQTSHLYGTHMHPAATAEPDPWARRHARCKSLRCGVFCSKLVNQCESWERGVSCWLGNEPSSGSGLISVLHSDFSVVSLCDKWSLFCLPHTQANGAQNILMSQKSRDTEEGALLTSAPYS